MPTPGVVLSNENGEEAPLLGARLPETTGRKEPRQDTHSYLKATLQYTALFAFVITTGIVAWLVSRHEETRSPEDPSHRPTDVIEWRSQAIGWTSACLYRKFMVSFSPGAKSRRAAYEVNPSLIYFFRPVGSRIPQIRTLDPVFLFDQHL